MSEEGEVTRLRARVEELERRLSERSRLLRSLARDLCEDDLASLSRMAMGLPPLPRAGIGLAGWRETTTFSTAEVERTMSEIWRSVSPPASEER